MPVRGGCDISQRMTHNVERVEGLARVVAKTNIKLNDDNANAEGLRVNTKKHRTKGQQSADGNVNAEGLKDNTERRSIRRQQITG